MSDKNVPIPGEVNPNHPVTQFARDQWHKIACLIMLKCGLDEMEITPELIAKLGQDRSIVLDCRGGHMVVRLVGPEEARRLAAEEGGLPA